MSDDDIDDIENDIDIDLDEFDDDDGGFDDFGGKQGTLSDLWKNSPTVKIGVIFGVFVLIVMGVILFGGGDEKKPVSRVTRAAEDLTEAPGTSEVSESYRKAIEEENTRRTEQALRDSTSAIPMPVEPAKGTLPLQVDEPEEEDPLERWRRMQEDRIQQQQIVNQDFSEPEPEQPKPDTRTPAVNALAQAMSLQMETVLKNQPIKGPRYETVTTPAYLENLAAKEREAQLKSLQKTTGGNKLKTPPIILQPAGEIEYAQLITEANTDVPGPILAQIASGPLKGAKLIGSFESTDKYITLNFNTIVIDGISEATDAVAIDPGTTLPGMATEIDHRYFKRVILPTAAAFIEGLTTAISDSGTTTVTISGETVTNSTADKSNDQEVASGISEAGKTLSEILDEEAKNTNVLIRIASGTPIGILFVQPVIKGAKQKAQIPTQIAPAQ